MTSIWFIFFFHLRREAPFYPINPIDFAPFLPFLIIKRNFNGGATLPSFLGLNCKIKTFILLKLPVVQLR